MSFWTDAKIADHYSVEEKFIYLYCLTNPHTNLCGCYEISFRQMAFESGLKAEKIADIIKGLQQKGVIAYSADTSELLVVNWHKYNWTASIKFRKPLEAEIDAVKDKGFREYLRNLFDNGAAEYSIDTPSDNDDMVSEPKKIKQVKHKYGSQQNVLLTDEEYSKLIAANGNGITDKAIENYSMYKAYKGYKVKSDYLAICKWGIKAVTEKKTTYGQKYGSFEQSTESYDDMEKLLLEN